MHRDIVFADGAEKPAVLDHGRHTAARMVQHTACLGQGAMRSNLGYVPYTDFADYHLQTLPREAARPPSSFSLPCTGLHARDPL
jgi:hypothetical protein